MASEYDSFYYCHERSTPYETLLLIAINPCGRGCVGKRNNVGRLAHGSSLASVNSAAVSLTGPCVRREERFSSQDREYKHARTSRAKTAFCRLRAEDMFCHDFSALSRCGRPTQEMQAGSHRHGEEQETMLNGCVAPLHTMKVSRILPLLYIGSCYPIQELFDEQASRACWLNRTIGVGPNSSLRTLASAAEVIMDRHAVFLSIPSAGIHGALTFINTLR
jgi:hypothetical protein